MTDLHAAIMNLPALCGPDPSSDYERGYSHGHRDARRAAAALAEQHHADVLRLRHAALWLGSNVPGTPVPEWVDAAVNDPDLVASGGGADFVADRLPEGLALSRMMYAVEQQRGHGGWATVVYDIAEPAQADDWAKAYRSATSGSVPTRVVRVTAYERREVLP